MILLFIILAGLQQTIDSLHIELKMNPQMSIITELNTYYVRQGNFSSAISELEKYENVVSWEDQALLHFLIADNYLYAGSLLAARAAYLTIVQRYTRSGIANDALERLYLLETARHDTTTLKQLTYTLSLMYSKQWQDCEDNLKNLINSNLAIHVYYYLAIMYRERDDIPQALSTLKALDQNLPGHHLLSVPVLRGELYLIIKDMESARIILEDFIIKHPNAIQTVRARALLETIQP